MSDSPTSRMVRQTYTVRFTTPAFLGDAEQSGAWRTPPFKALLRQWWRIVAAQSHDYDYKKLRETEGRLFGNAWLKDNFSQSQVRLRFEEWRPGKMNTWNEASNTTSHPEIKFPIDANLYLGYGPLTRNKEAKKTTFKDKLNAAIQAGENNILKIIYADEKSLGILETLQLIHWFGTLGGRSRNGWGSLLLEGDGLNGLEALNQFNSMLEVLAKPLNECLQLDWPHALGKSNDNSLLIWKTKSGFSSWREAMKELARIKIAFRTTLKFTKPGGQLDRRHLLAYPVTHHHVDSWTNQSRLANQMRFKVIADNQQHFIGIAYHLPCSIPKELQVRLDQADRNWINEQQLSVWQAVHQKLDAEMQRI